MNRPPAPDGYIWRDHAEALTQLLNEEIERVVNHMEERIVQRIHDAGEDLTLVMREEIGRAVRELNQLRLAFDASLGAKPS